MTNSELRNGSGITSRIDLEHAAERHENRSHAGAWERGFSGSRRARSRNREVIPDLFLKQEILEVLSELVEHCPDVRFGQLIVNLSCIARGPTPEAVWDMEDDELLAATKSHLEDYERRHAGIA